MNWQENPPDEEQWLAVKNEGYWWIKITIPTFTEDGLTFPETYLYEIVRIVQEHLNCEGERTDRLCFNAPYTNKTVYCDDLTAEFRNVLWQPVANHTDN